MPKTLLCETYDQNLRERGGLVYKTGKVYDLGKGIRVKLKKETNRFTKYAGLGLQTISEIPKNVCIGYFKTIKTSQSSLDGYFNVRLGKDKFAVLHNDSLMNKANTIPYAKERQQMCNCVVKVFGNHVGLKTIKDIRPGSMLWANYGCVPTHYWKIKYQICKARLNKTWSLGGAWRRGNPNLRNADNDSTCRDCRRRHVELLMCDTCRISICRDHLTRTETFLLNKDYFFCKDCLENPPPYPNRFIKRKKVSQNKMQKFLQQYVSLSRRDMEVKPYKSAGNV